MATTCPWCKSEAAGVICPVCKGPNGWMLLVFAPYWLAAIAIIPVALTWLTIVFSNRQTVAARALDTHEKLLAAYVDFENAHSDYRYASEAITFLASSRETTVPAKDLKAAALDLDNAFDSVGAKLTPFEDAQKRLSSDGHSVLEDIWQKCFIHSYFDIKQNTWPRVEAEISNCDSTSCPTSVARAADTMLKNFKLPKCEEGSPDLQNYGGAPVNMATIWSELTAIIAAQRVDEAKPVRPDARVASAF